MKKLSLLIVLLITSCTSVKTEKTKIFSTNMTFDEFKSNLEIYINNSEYPDLDE